MKSIKHNGLTLRIEYDDYADYNPREIYSNLGQMLCWHSRYEMGDNNPYLSPQDFWEDKDLQQEIYAYRKVYMLDHSGVYLSNAPFACDPYGYDSGVVGIVYATKDSVMERYSELTDGIKELVLQDLSQEIVEYNQYLNPSYRAYTIEGLNGELLDSCGGFEYGNELEMLIEMKNITNLEFAPLFDKAIKELTAQEM